MYENKEQVLDLITRMRDREERYMKEAADRNDMEDFHRYSHSGKILDELILTLGGYWTHGPETSK